MSVPASSIPGSCCFYFPLLSLRMTNHFPYRANPQPQPPPNTPPHNPPPPTPQHTPKKHRKYQGAISFKARGALTQRDSTEFGTHGRLAEGIQMSSQSGFPPRARDCLLRLAFFLSFLVNREPTLPIFFFDLAPTHRTVLFLPPFSVRPLPKHTPQNGKTLDLSASRVF